MKVNKKKRKRKRKTMLVFERTVGQILTSLSVPISTGLDKKSGSQYDPNEISHDSSRFKNSGHPHCVESVGAGPRSLRCLAKKSPTSGESSNAVYTRPEITAMRVYGKYKYPVRARR